MALLERLRIGAAAAGLPLTTLPSTRAAAPAGALDIYVRNRSPGTDEASNGLPAPAAAYDPIMRIEGPDRSVLDGAWKFPERQKR